MGLPPKPRGAAWPRGAWAYDHCVAGARGRRGAARAPISQSNLRGGGAREMSKMERGGPRARRSRAGRRCRGREAAELIRCLVKRAARLEQGGGCPPDARLEGAAY